VFCYLKRFAALAFSGFPSARAGRLARIRPLRGGQWTASSRAWISMIFRKWEKTHATLRLALGGSYYAWDIRCFSRGAGTKAGSNRNLTGNHYSGDGKRSAHFGTGDPTRFEGAAA